MKYELSNSQKEQLLSSIHAGIDEANVPKQAKVSRLVYIAAIAAAVVGVVFGLTFLFKSDVTNPTSISNPNNRTVTIQGADVYTLPDGSTIKTQQTSTIVFDPTFEPRKLSFVGQAIFDVQTDKAKPFQIDLNNKFKVEVTGTSFELESKRDSIFDLTLIEGAVAIKNKLSDQEVAVKPGQTISLENNRLRISKNRSGYRLAWHRGFYELDDVIFVDICNYMTEHYALDIDLQTNLEGLRVSGRYPYDRKPESFLQAISKLYKLDISKKDGKIVIGRD